MGRPRRRNVIREVAAGPLGLAAGLLAASSAYPLVLLAAAWVSHGRDQLGPRDYRLRLLVLVPAHNEEAVLADTLAALAHVDYPPERVGITVIADNCTDRTAEIATAAGATVLIRDDPGRRGKGAALAWALDELREGLDGVDAVVFLDADCRPSPDALAALAGKLVGGWPAAQAAYVVSNPEDSSASALRWAAFALANTIRPLGREALGLSAGINGSGFALTRELLRRHPWQSFSLAEDAEYHLRLVSAGEQVGFVRDAFVASPMPTSLRSAHQQNSRWEGGKRQLAGSWAPRLLVAGAKRRDHARALPAIELLLPPQSLLAISQVAIAVAARALGVRRAEALAVLGVGAQAAYVLGGLHVAGAPAAVYKALARVPAFVVCKAALQLRVLVAGGPEDWVGTRDLSP